MVFILIFFVSFIIALSGALMPGPLLTSVIYESFKHGTKTGPLIILGHAILEIFMIALIIFGLSNIAYNINVIRTISFLGSNILLYFGISMLKSLPTISLEIKPSTKTSSQNLVLTGITLSIANPYWSIWWLTIGLGLVISAQKVGYLGIISFFVGHILADLLWYSLVSYTINRGKEIISLKTYKTIILVCAVVLIIFSIYFGITTFTIKI